MWLTSAELGTRDRAFGVILMPRLYIELMRAARASTPTDIERQKNYGCSIQYKKTSMNYDEVDPLPDVGKR